MSTKTKKLHFLDTPGHAAFSKIRERGANLTDVSVLVVAADDGFMPQTDEALKFAQRAQGTLLVAINKMDAKGADQEKVKTQMQERSIPSEDWGGEVVTVPISALKGDGVDDLLDMILLQAELMELKANPEAELEELLWRHAKKSVVVLPPLLLCKRVLSKLETRFIVVLFIVK